MKKVARIIQILVLLFPLVGFGWCGMAGIKSAIKEGPNSIGLLIGVCAVVGITLSACCLYGIYKYVKEFNAKNK